MLKLDGTETKARLGANAILAVSLGHRQGRRVLPRPAALQILGAVRMPRCWPVPMANVINGRRPFRRAD